MTTAAVVLAALLAIAAVLWVARPLLARDGGGDPGGPDGPALERLRLLEARDRALAALKELEFDHRTGKISDADYAELVRHLRQEAAGALAALDVATAGGQPAVEPAEATLEGPEEQELEGPAPPNAVPTTAPEREERPR